MSKPVKEMVRKALARQFGGVTSLAIVGFSGLDATSTNQVRARLRQKQVRLTVVKNSLARQAFKSVGLDRAAELLDGPCAIAYGLDPEHVGLVEVVRELLAIGKDSPALTVKAALMEGDVFRGEGEVQALSRFPTRGEAISQLAGCLLAAGANLSACLIATAGQLAGVVKAIEEKQEKAGSEAA